MTDCARGKRAGQLPFLTLAAAGLLLIWVPEVIILADGYSPPYVRMNTMFKLGFAAWALFGAALPAMLISGWTEIAGAGRRVSLVSGAGRGGPAGRIAGGLARLLGQRGDGAGPRRGYAVAERAADHASLRPEDVAAANWAAANLPRDAVIMEACCRAYSDANRISNWTGCPA